jgi:hypothetical protein
MFLITWMFDKLGYMPKIKIDAGVVAAWPFPETVEKPKTTIKRKPAVKKPAVVAKTARAKKAK